MAPPRLYPALQGESSAERKRRVHAEGAKRYYHRVVKHLSGEALEAHRKRSLEAWKKYAAANVEKCRARTRRGYRTAQAHLGAYGLTASDYDSMVIEQDGTCAICRKPPGRKALAIDHDHALADKQESIRGLLCTNCNLMVGLAKDNVTVLKSAIEYLGG